jgi:hypothetical protein
LFAPMIEPSFGASHSMVAPADIADVLKVCILPLQPFAGTVNIRLAEE